MTTIHFEEMIEAAFAKAYLHPSMTAAVVDMEEMIGKLSVLVHQVYQLEGFPLSQPDASLDVVFGRLGNTPDPLAVIRNLVRILHPGGRLVLQDAAAHPQEQVREWLAQAGLVNIIVDGVTTGTKHLDMRESVQRDYAAKALSSDCGCADDCCSATSAGSDNCCAPGCCSPGLISLDDVVAGSVNFDPGYSAGEKADVPAAAAQISLGCGNPTAMANLREGQVVLDIGSGGGIDAFLASKKVGATGRVIGVDMTPAMLERARATAQKNGYDNVQFLQGYAEKLPVDEATVDVIISNCVINLTEDKGKVFREAFRALRLGGRLEVNDMVFGGPVSLAARYSSSGWSECVSGALPEAEYIDLVKQAGFSDISVRRSTSGGQSLGVPVYSVQLSARK